MPDAFISRNELEPVLAYLESQPGIREILVSGGDPLCADNGELEELFTKLRKARPGILIRLCSRVPITNPERLTRETISLLMRFRPMRLVTHINHPKELGTGDQGPGTNSISAGVVLTSVAAAGIPVHVQTVLLRGINDNAEILAALFRACLDLGLSPYYLFQLDLAPGAAHFRVPLKEGLSIYRDLGRRIGGLGLPAFAVDLPGGGGKIRLDESVIAGEEDRPGGGVFLLKGMDGRLWAYPAD